ncbi:DEAD/DEAH box helicase family protein [Azotobacter vinelandii]|uniref:DEAD/DEAH box helicase family protein n=1 Tax=Azotobacter vinelandii TaxID=354 RepID=UPI000910CC48|nr:DEAD/DEAH box helicase family protein [Azotobacter vinelandii]SFX90496.1 Type III restriction enzyme, res subunit [Azotobacter vinelandii]
MRCASVWKRAWRRSSRWSRRPPPSCSPGGSARIRARHGTARHGTARGGPDFHAGQRQAILNAIVAHEVLGSATLQELYQRVAPDALLAGKRLAEVGQAKHTHPKYCLKMATGTGKTWVLQALLVWQLLNRTAALEAGVDDPRFTRNFLIVAPGLIVYERLLDAFLGKEIDGRRDFASSDVARYAELFIPEAHRERVFGFVRGNTCTRDEIGLKVAGNGLIALCNWHLLGDAAGRSGRSPGGDRRPAAVATGQGRRQRPGRARPSPRTRQRAGLSGRSARSAGVQRRSASYPCGQARGRSHRGGVAEKPDADRRGQGAALRAGGLLGHALQRRGQRQEQEEAVLPAHHRRLRPEDGHGCGTGEIAGTRPAQGDRRVAAGVQGRARRRRQSGP